MPRSGGTHFKKLSGLIRTDSRPTAPRTAEMRLDLTNNVLEVYSSSSSAWYGIALTTSTSSSTSTTTT
jgi:hypothetical protein